MTFRAVIVVVGLSLLLGQAPRVDAQPDAATVKQAAGFYATGQQAFEQERYRDAIVAFEQAYALVPTDGSTIWALGHTYHRQYLRDEDPEKLRRAVELLRAYLAAPANKKWREQASYDLKDLEPQLTRVEADAARAEAVAPPPPPTVLVIGSPTAGASVTLDGAAAQPAPAVVTTSPGPHQVEVSAPGYSRVTRQAVAVEGKSILLEVPLVELPATLTVRGAAGGRVAIDGQLVGTVGQPIQIAAGRHRVTVIERGRYAWDRELELARGQRTSVDAALEVTTQRRASRYVIGGGVAVIVGAGVAALVAVSAQSDAQGYNDRVSAGATLTVSELVAYNDAIDRRDAWRTASYITAGTGLALVGAGMLMYFLDTPRVDGNGPPRTITPTVTPDSATVSWQGQF